MKKHYYIKEYCHLKDGRIWHNGEVLFEGGSFAKVSSKQASPDLTSFLKTAYRHFELDYPKFFKMDRLSKLAFMAAEILFGTWTASFKDPFPPKIPIEKSYRENASFENTSIGNTADAKVSHGKTSLAKPSVSKTSPEIRNTAIVLSNRASSLDTDRKYQQSISDLDNFYPSPAVFVYTLPNICIGEISIRHRLRSENSFFIFDAFDAGFLADYAENLLNTEKADEVLCGWVDVDEDRYEAFVYIVSPSGSLGHSEQQLTKLYHTP